MFDIDLVNSTYNDLSNKVKTDLDDQYTKGRLTGSDYANVYATLMNTILQLSFQAPEKSKQIELQDQQILNEQAQEKLIEAQTQVQLNSINVQNQQIATEQAQEDLIKAQTQVQLNTINVQNQQILNEQAQEKLIEAQTQVQLNTVNVQDQQISKDKAQENLIDAQTKVQLNTINVQNQQILNEQAQEKLINAQTLDQEEHTKLQQVQEDLIKEQTEVAKKQVKSFDQNIQLKLFKAQMDTWGVMFGSGMLEKKPSIITNDQVSSLYNQIKSSIN